MEDTPSSGNIVEEFPAPPAYYKQFSSELDTIPFPTIPEANPYLSAFHGSFAYVHENTPKFVENRNYKSDLKKSIQAIMTCCMELVASRAQTQSFPVEQKVLQLRTKLAEFHDILHEYREVEATEKLIEEMKIQLRDAEALEGTLQSVLEKSQEIMKMNTHTNPNSD